MIADKHLSVLRVIQLKHIIMFEIIAPTDILTKRIISFTVQNAQAHVILMEAVH